MAGATVRAVHEPFQMLFGAGTCAGLTDGDLLARFVAGRDEAGELAFEALVKRHGPMVQGVCRQVLDDHNDVHDSFQAVFMVLARRADAIRNRNSVGSWLYGVAVRVAARARVAAIRRDIRERRAAKAALAKCVGSPAAQQVESSPVEREERAGVVHHELSRLPEKYRAPIVLCYMEGLTHDQAAACLSWPVGTVRSRLSRGRDTLRRRLSRRGLAAPVVVGPLGAWLACDQAALAATASTIPGNLVAQVMKLVSQTAAGRCTAVASAQATSMALADGVLKMLMLKKLTVAAAVVLSIGTITIGGGVALVRTSKAEDAQSKAAPSETGKTSLPDTQAKTAEPVEVDVQFQELVRLVAERYEYQLLRYMGGQTTIDRLIAAYDQLENIELRAAKSPLQQLKVRERALKRLKGIETIVETEVKNGRLPAEDLGEFRLRRMQLEIEQKNAGKEETDLTPILRRMKQLELNVEQSKGSSVETRKAPLPDAPAGTANALDVDPLAQQLVDLARSHFELQGRLYAEGEIAADSIIDASKQLENAESKAAKSPAERNAAKQRHLTRLKDIEARVTPRVKEGRASSGELQGVKVRRMQVELDLKTGDKEESDLSTVLRLMKKLELRIEELEKRVPPPPGRT